MTITQVSRDRVRDRMITQLRSALQATREQIETEPPRIGRSTRRRFAFHHHGFDIDIHVSLTPDWKVGCRSTEAIDNALNMAIGAADRLDERGAFDYSPRSDGKVTVRIIAQPGHE